MRIDLATETPISLRDVRNHPLLRRDGRPIAPSTVWRWLRRGCRAADGTIVKLESYRAGGRTMTTIQAIERFVTTLTAHSEPSPDVGGSSVEQDTRLIDAGLLQAKERR